MSVNIYDKTTGTIQQIAGNAFDSGSGGGNADTLDGKHASDFALKTDIPTELPANGGNADTVDGKHAIDFGQNLGLWDSGDIKDKILGTNCNGFVLINSGVSGMPFDGLSWFGIVQRYSDNLKGILVYNFGTGMGYSNTYLNGTWKGWQCFANEGNADTLDGKHAADFMQNLGVLTTGSLLDYVLTMTDSGYLLVSNNVTDTPVSGQFFFVDVKRYSGGHYAITATRFNAGGVYTNRYNNNSNMKKWYGWANVADGGNAATVNGLTVQTAVPANAKFTDTTYGAATESVSGLVSTTTQNFAGNKFVQAERVGIRMMGVTKGTAPTSNQIAHIQFNDNSGANADSASVGQIYHQVQKDTGASILTLQAVDAMTAGGTNRTTLSVVYATDNCYVNVSTPSNPARSCLRNLSSGTAEKNTTNCPSGSWYGRHS